ncbi:MAG: hypothetical protein LBG28_14460 [Tannerella sp.]|nr:hypothetical protein [Tannerella sp.]
MKKIFTYLFTIIMTALVFYGGAGINIILYCCNHCRSVGIETMLKDNCCERHNHTCNYNDSNSHSKEPAEDAFHNDCRENNRPTGHIAFDGHNGYNNEHAGDDCCNIKRISFDWTSHSFSELEIDLSPTVFNLLPYEIVDISNINHLISEAGMIMMTKGPPVYPRDCLSKYTVLLI